MGCSSSKDLEIIPYTGEGLIKEEYKGIPSKCTAPNIKLTNYFAKFTEWRGKQFISRDDYKGYRQMMNDE